jgi:hypothetical protein
MTDLLERLRAANPVRTRNPPAIEDVWRELEHGAHGSNRDTSRRAGRGRDRVFSKVRLRASHGAARRAGDRPARTWPNRLAGISDTTGPPQASTFRR